MRKQGKCRGKMVCVCVLKERRLWRERRGCIRGRLDGFVCKRERLGSVWMQRQVCVCRDGVDYEGTAVYL